MKNFEWAVIGAGPAGIAAVGKLLDADISPEKILWLDPEFGVGDLGKYWYEVPSNTKIESFRKFLFGCRSFHFDKSPKHFVINNLDNHEHCQLSVMNEALLWITAELRKNIFSHTGFVSKLSWKNNSWFLQANNEGFIAKKIILATGAEPKTIAHAPTTIDLKHALNPKQISHYFALNDVIGVVGSSHSAVLVIKNLLDAGAKQVINFYRSPFLYAIYFDDCILYDNTGLKGQAADWTRENLDKNILQNLTRIDVTQKSLQEELGHCDKVVYAIGFESRELPIIECDIKYNYLENDGMIAPNLFGLGIAYPEALRNPVKVYEYRVGLSKFMDYLNRVLPMWARM